MADKPVYALTWPKGKPRPANMLDGMAEMMEPDSTDAEKEATARLMESWNKRFPDDPL